LVVSIAYEVKTLTHYNIRDTLFHKYWEDSVFSYQVINTCNIRQGTAMSQSHLLAMPATHETSWSFTNISANLLRVAYRYPYCHVLWLIIWLRPKILKVT